MALGIVLDPCVHPATAGPTTVRGTVVLAGATVGVRLDTAWRSWDWIVEEWAERLRATGAEMERSSQQIAE